jgi:hypothetical protein
VTRIEQEVQTAKLIDRIRVDEVKLSQFERMTAFLDAERLRLGVEGRRQMRPIPRVSQKVWEPASATHHKPPLQ